MFYNWSGKPYRSKQIDVVPIVVTRTVLVNLQKIEGHVSFQVEVNKVPDILLGKDLWKIEGFESYDCLQKWFLDSLGKKDSSVRYLNLFDLYDQTNPFF